MSTMERVNAIWKHPAYQEHYQAIQELEAHRIFCGHTAVHFLDVARLAYVQCLEQKLKLSKELIYSAALLHDIGRDMEYTLGTPHEEAGAAIAKPILRDCGFSPEESGMILEAIKGHRGQEPKSQDDRSVLGELLYKADKKSRNCFLCSAREACNWPSWKKNMEIHT